MTSDEGDSASGACSLTLGSGCAARARARADDATDVTQTQGRVYQTMLAASQDVIQLNKPGG